MQQASSKVDEKDKQVDRSGGGFEGRGIGCMAEGVCNLMAGVGTNIPVFGIFYVVKRHG